MDGGESTIRVRGPLSAFLLAALCSGAVAEESRRLPDAEIAVVKGRPSILVDGKPVPHAGYSAMIAAEEMEGQIEAFSRHRMGFYMVAPPQIPGPQWDTPFWVGDRTGAEPIVAPKFDTRMGLPIEKITEADPNACFIVRFPLFEPSTWSKLHPEEFAVNENGERLTTPSLASQAYWARAAEFCRAVVEYYEGRPWAHRIIGYADFLRTEGTHEPAIGGWMFDHSAPMQRRWRAWLRGKYGTIDALRAAWNQPGLEDFDRVPVPKDPLRGPAPEVVAQLYWQAAKDNQELRDYLLLQRDIFHQRFKEIHAATRAGAKRKVIVIYDGLKQVMQGWDIDDFFGMSVPRSLGDPEVMSGSGHMAVARLFDVAGMDGLITPHDYQARGIGGIFEPEGIADSAVLRGKIFLCEMDTRTYAGRDHAYGAARDQREFDAITWRNLATALTRGFWPYWFDLTFAFFVGDPIHATTGRQVEVLKEAAAWPHATVPGIAVILDDQATLETNGAGNYLAEAIMGQIRGGLSRCGVPYRVHLLEDLALPGFPAHRVYYFPNLFKVDDARLALLKEKGFRDGNVVVWGPGSGISDGTTIDAGHVRRLTGFACNLYPVNYPHRVLLTNYEHPVTRGLAADTLLGGPLPYGPLVFPNDGTELGLAWTKQGRCEVGLAVKDFGRGARGAFTGKEPLGPGDYAAVFTHALPLTADLWRNLARFAGAHVYCDANDVVLADSSIVALHSVQSGPRRIALPGPCDVYDVVSGKAVARGAREIRFDLRAPETRVFRLESVK
jgi:hypothetical protein